MQNLNEGLALQEPYTRLSVNVHPDVAAAIRAVMGREHITATEFVRRAASVYKSVSDEQAAGNRFLVQRGPAVSAITFTWEN